MFNFFNIFNIIQLVFSKDEIRYLKNSSELIREKHNDKYPIYVFIDSKILSITNHKFLANRYITIHQLIDIIVSLLVNHNPEEELNISIKTSDNEFLINCKDILDEKLYKIYRLYCDKKIFMLYIVISRVTFFKSLKSKFF
jgi:hypothetical protein